jgi:hypothetical protein
MRDGWLDVLAMLAVPIVALILLLIAVFAWAGLVFGDTPIQNGGSCDRKAQATAPPKRTTGDYPRCAICQKPVEHRDMRRAVMVHADGTPLCKYREVFCGPDCGCTGPCEHWDEPIAPAEQQRGSQPHEETR